MIETKLSQTDIELLEKYNKQGPRYTSYPTAPEWRNDFTSEEYVEQLLKLSKNKDIGDFSLYFHIPFCEDRCLYCGCHVIIDKNRRYVDKYLDYINKELILFKKNLTNPCNVSQLHLGGGTPTFLKEPQIEKLFNAIAQHFTIEKDAEVAIEIDPCVTTKNQIKLLRDVGFNRISMGIQDFNPSVQKAVNRIQDEKLTVELINYARSLGFLSVNIDLIYGLPLQTIETFSNTIKKIIEISPERIALFSYAKIPWLKPHQKKINEKDLPNTTDKFSIFLTARKLLVDNGYEAIGMDHFAKPNDELAVALKNKTLHRNFMGYTVKSTNNFIGFGVSSIGYVNQTYTQNV
ncbi:MAG: oxygen-independent coproporphyrinogen III oxidase, partial [Spirochaetota bacterium]|nr:oxygen-independent coproporphyrinogen III oxidase [Spirochaetota bacterium]